MILANFTVNRWITVGRLEREGGGFFFLDGSSRHRAIFPSLCAAGILRDKSDKSIRHAELTYDPSPFPPAVPRLRTRSKASSVPIPGKRATFYHNTFILVPEFVLFSRQVNRPTRRYLSLPLPLSEMIVARPDLPELGRNFAVTFLRTNFPGKRKMNYYPSGISPVNPGFLRCKSLVEGG